MSSTLIPGLPSITTLQTIEEGGDPGTFQSPGESARLLATQGLHILRRPDAVFSISSPPRSSRSRKGFALATGDILMILDADLTMPPEDLPKFYDAIASGKGEFINGCRLVYPMEVAGDAGAESPGEQVLQHGFLLVAEPADQRHALWNKSLISS